MAAPFRRSPKARAPRCNCPARRRSSGGGFPLAKLNVGLECGGSDTTSGLASNPSIGVVADYVVANGGTAIITETSEFFGAEHLFAERAATPDVGKKILETIRGHEQDIVALGIDLRGSNPSLDNIRGGLSTIEEKALGAMSKAGKSKVIEVLSYGQMPKKPGLHFMAGPAPAWSRSPACRPAAASCASFPPAWATPSGTRWPLW